MKNIYPGPRTEIGQTKQKRRHCWS